MTDGSRRHGQVPYTRQLARQVTFSVLHVRRCAGAGTSYTQREATSQYLRPRYDRHFVGITWHNVWSYAAKIYRVI